MSSIRTNVPFISSENRALRPIGADHARPDLREDLVMADLCTFLEFHFLNPLIRTTSLVVAPREKRVGLPSRERSNHAI